MAISRKKPGRHCGQKVTDNINKKKKSQVTSRRERRESRVKTPDQRTIS